MQDKVVPYVFWCTHFLVKSHYEKCRKSEFNKLFWGVNLNLSLVENGIKLVLHKKALFSYFIIISYNKKKRTWEVERNAKRAR